MPRALSLTISTLCLLIAGVAHAQKTFKEYVEHRDDPDYFIKEGEVLIDRSSYKLPFKVRIISYTDERGEKRNGPWTFKFDRLGPKTPKREFPDDDGQHFKASAVMFEVVTDYGKKLGKTENHVKIDGKHAMLIVIDEESLPPLLVPKSAAEKDRELVELIMKCESLRNFDTQRIEWINSILTTDFRERRDLKNTLREEWEKTRTADSLNGRQVERKPRSYRVVPDDDKRLTANQ